MLSSQALPRTLLHLDISHNAVQSLDGLGALTSLQWLDASGNRIQVLTGGPASCSHI
jgi:Leucine-rich repeat (LRR) protein